MATTALRPAMAGEGQAGVHPFFTKVQGPTAARPPCGNPLTRPFAHDESSTAPVERAAPSQTEETVVGNVTVDNQAQRQRSVATNVLEQRGRKRRKTGPETSRNRRFDKVEVQIMVEPPRFDLDDPARTTGALSGTTKNTSNEGDQRESDPRDGGLTQNTKTRTAVLNGVKPLDLEPNLYRADNSPCDPIETIGDHSDSQSASTAEMKALPTRMLQLKNGKFPSPKNKRRSSRETNQGSAKKRKSTPRSIIAVVRYAERTDKLEFGARLDRILDGSERIEKAVPRTPQKPAQKKRLIKGDGPVGAAHPFFMGKPKTSNCAKPVEPAAKGQSGQEAVTDHGLKPRRATAVTPGKLKAQIEAERVQKRNPVFGGFGCGPTARHNGLLKHPGAKDAPWPARGEAHIHGYDPTEQGFSLSEKPQSPLSLDTPKGKRSVPIIAPTENILRRFKAELNLRQISLIGLQPSLQSEPTTLYLQADTSSSFDFRKPTRLLMSGADVQSRIRKELRTLSFNPFVANGPEPRTLSRFHGHSLLGSLYEDLASYLNPFNRFECEQSSWVRKYEPRTTEDVLQSGPEARVIRDWLRRSTITAVQTSSKRSNASALSGTTSSLKAKTEKRKRKKKTSELDDFIVMSEDEDNDTLDELIEIERFGQQYKHNSGPSLVRGGVDTLSGQRPSKKISTTLLLSGPHGSGKTAAVYAAAKELGFQVFEINSGSRRSGRDVLEKIGDMTENHLVQQVSKALSDPHSGNFAKPIDVKAVQDEPASNQNRLATFFKSATAKADNGDKQRPKTASASVQETDVAPPKARKEQKQSLILFEEIDVVFEEDKQFLMTVLTLAINSKRPIVLTCNDENLVPIDALTLHAILRFEKTPAELAVDYLLLLAAREGHLLKRAAVESLYVSRGRDLRASIMELDFWCQMGIGDNKGGLEWLYQRWPPGRDVDTHGNTLRVVSDDTYSLGTGWYNPELTRTAGNQIVPDETSLLSTVRSDWQLHYSDFVDFNPTEELASAAQLDNIVFRLECLSAADLYCDIDHAATKFDCTLPELSDKTRLNFPNLLSHRLLQDTPQLDCHSLGSKLACSALSIRRTTSREPSAFNGLSHQSKDLQTHPLTASIIASQTRKFSPPQQLTRNDFSLALDALATDPNPPSSLTNTATTSLILTSLDREFSVISTEIAPYARIIAAYDLRLEDERLRMSNLLSIGGTGKAKMRKTRAARSALEGGRREETRRERWWAGLDIDLKAVLRTAGNGWVSSDVRGEGLAFDAGSMLSGEETDEIMGSSQ